MKRSGFTRNKYATGQWLRRTPLARGSRLRVREGAKRLKRKPTEWDRVRAVLKPLFEARGVVKCEFGFPGCWQDDTLGFAHSRKRTDPYFEMYEVALACSANCHRILDEQMSHAAMYEAVWRAIGGRGLILPESKAA